MQNKTEAKEQNALSIKGSLPECDLYTWLQIAAKNRELTNLPINLDLLIDKLNIFDNQFHAVSLRYNSQDNKIYLNSDKIAGVVKLSNNESPVKLDFDKIIIDGVEQIKSKSQELTPDNLPTVEFKCENMILKGNTVGWIKFNLIPKPYGYDIKDVSIENENFDLQGNGQWNMLDKQTTHFIGNITGRNIGNLFEDWGLGRSIKRGSGNIAFTFNWNGSPIDFKFADTVGDVNLDIVSGHIRGVNPGFGRVIGLLSLDNIQRRLKLDFSDFVGKGFAFDKLQTVFNINHGTLHTEGIFIDGPSAYIALTGDAYIKTKQINFKMGVVPKMGSSLPLAAAITAGPVIGAAFLILGKAAGHKEDFKKIPRYGYNVTGTWENPEIHEIKKEKREKE
jgi:uncharacterized protein YhdP